MKKLTVWFIRLLRKGPSGPLRPLPHGRGSVTSRVPLAAWIVCVFVAQLPAQDTAELLARMKAMEERIKTLEAEVQTLKGRQPAPSVELAPSPAVSLGGAPPAASKVFNPDISVNGNFLGAAGNGAN